MDIKVLKLSSGEEFITEIRTVVENGQTFAQMVNPCVVVMKEQVGGRVGMEFFPVALAAAERTVILSPDAVVYSGEPSEEAAATYNKRYSKIITPDQKLVLAS